MVLPPEQMPSTSLKAPASRIRLSSSDFRKLRHIGRAPESSAEQALSAKVLLQAALGRTDKEIAETLQTTCDLVSVVIQRFARCRFASFDYGLYTRPSIAEADAKLDVPMHRAKQAIPITLTVEQKRDLRQIRKAQTSEQRMVLRAKIILDANEGSDNSKIAHKLGVDVKTVRKWRMRYSLMGLEGLFDAPRSGRPFKFEASARHELFTAAVGEPPEPYSTWSLDLLAKHLVDAKLVSSISIETISYWLRTADLKPHRVRGWLNSKDPEFRRKRDEIVKLYQFRPTDGKLLSVDEKTSIQALERVRKDLPAGPGQRKRVEWEYKRHGTANLIASFDVSTGQIIAEILKGRNDSEAFINFLKKLLTVHPEGKLYLILDNGSTHRSKETTSFFEAHKDRLVPVFTPTHASWLNQIEIWFSVMSRHALRKASFSSRDKLVERIKAYIEHHNRELAMPYEWSTKGRPLTGASAKDRRRQRNLPKEFRKAS